jgi:signal transduction histidine kinase
MFDERRDRSFAHDAPEEWQRMQEAESGQFRTASGMYTYRTVYPLRALLGPGGVGVPPTLRNTYQWKLVSYIPQPQLAAARADFWAVPQYTWILLGGMLAVVSWLFARLSADHQRARRQLLERQRLAAIGEAMTALAHESRNALQRSSSGLEMLKKRVAGDREASGLVGEVQEAQVYLTDLYEEARGYAATVNLRREPSDLRRLLQETWGQLISQRPDKIARVVECPPPGAIDSAEPSGDGTTNTRCDVDPRAISQVFRNVLENALAAADPAQVEIRWAETRLNGRPAVRLAVRDNGPGISREHREHIFEPFYTTKVRGTGLGLAISRRLVAAHGGEIVVAPTDGPGAEFWITLPRSAL